jgi:hypothetical protein
MADHALTPIKISRVFAHLPLTPMNEGLTNELLGGWEGWIDPDGPIWPDRSQLETFVRTTFKHAAAADNVVSLRAFVDDSSNRKFKITAVKLNGDLNVLVEAAYRLAELAACAPDKVVFCPPVATFNNAKHAREQDLAEGLVLSIECDAHPQAAREKLEKLLGPPTLVVESGGMWVNPETGKGEPKLHLYWVLKVPARNRDELARLKQARRLATTIAGGDASNVTIVHPIRWPGSLHRKGESKLCRIIACNPDTEIELDIALEILQKAVGDDRPRDKTNGSGAAAIEVAEKFRHLDPRHTLNDSIVIPESPLLPFAPIRAECGWLRHVHETGGADQSERLWWDALRCGVFLEDGERLIHEFSSKYVKVGKDGTRYQYDFAETEAKFDRVRKDQKKKDLGWPQCQTICDDGSAQCKSCPHLVKGGSPLHLVQQAPLVPGDIKPPDVCEPVNRDAPELAKLDVVWMTRIFEGDTDGTYQNDQSQLAFAVACELVRVKLDSIFIARVLLTTPCGGYVQENPAYRLNRTIRRAHEFAYNPDLEKMNSQHAVLPIGGKTRVVTWGDDSDFPGRKTIVRAQTFDDFKNLHSNKRKRIKSKDEDGKQTTKYVPLGHWWLSQRHRRQYDGGQKFMPQHEAEVVGNVLNMFEGFPIQPRKPEGHSAASACQLFLDHGFKIICSGDEEHWDYLLKREAWIAQNRRRCEIAAAYRTEEEGSGKGFWCNHLGRLYGQYYMQVKRPEHVVGKHNRHLETLLKLCADEAVFVGDPRHRNTLFGLITEPTIDIEPKFIDVYQALNHLNVDIISNAKHFVPVSRTARRFFIPTVSMNRLRDFDYFNAITKQLRDDGGYEALLYHLLYEVDLRDFEIRRVPRTAGLAEQASYSRKGVDGLVEKVCSEGYVPCAHFFWPGFSISSGYENRQGFDHFIDNHVDNELRHFGALKVKRQLCKDWDCVTGRNARRRYGNATIHGILWPSLQELRARFMERHGPQDWLNPDIDKWPAHEDIGDSTLRVVG